MSATPPPPPDDFMAGPREPDSDARTWGMLCHLAAFAGYLIPLGWLIGPLVVWLIKREQYAFVDIQGKESVNFQISILIYTLISGVLFLVLIGMVLLPAVLIFQIVMVIIAMIKASNGEYFRYPLCIRFIN